MIAILQSVKYIRSTIIRKAHLLEIQLDSGSYLSINRNFIKILLYYKKFISFELLNNLEIGAVFAKIGNYWQRIAKINLSDSGQLTTINEKILEMCNHFKLNSFKDGEKNNFKLFQKLHGRLNCKN
jgi:hypothetical protein